MQTEEYEGPLDTLLSMIRSRELYINDISLAQVTDDYLSYIQNHSESLESMAEFVQIAATLVLAKSKSLLPGETTAQQDQEVDNLEDQLRAYRLIKNRAKKLQDEFGSKPAFARRSDQGDPDVFAPGNTLTTDKLRHGIKRNVLDLPDDTLPSKRIEDSLPLEEEITRLKECCTQKERVTFSSVARSDKKYHQIVTFVAILELNHQGEIQADQPRQFADITIQKQ